MTEPPTVTEIANLLVAFVALIVALISGVYTWRAYALQRQSTSAAGLDFLHVERHEVVDEVLPDEKDPTKRLRKQTFKPYMVSVILSRGPGVRYGAQGAVWGKGALSVLTPQVQVWGPDHPGIEFELKRGPKGEWEGVYCGMVWETPRMFRKGFTTDGFRMRVDAPGQNIQEFHAEKWSARKQQWVALKGGRDVNEDEPLDDAANRGQSFNGQLADRYPDDDVLDILKNAFNRGKSKE